MSQRMFATYMLRFEDGSFYVGQTDNLVRRMATYERGEGEGYVVRHGPFELVHVEWFASREEAVAREKQLQPWSRAKKEALIAGDVTRLHQIVHGEWRAEGIERPAHRLLARHAPGLGEKSLERAQPSPGPNLRPRQPSIPAIRPAEKSLERAQPSPGPGPEAPAGPRIPQ